MKQARRRDIAGGKGDLDDVVLAFDGGGSVEHRYLHGPAVDELFADESAADGLLWALADRQGTVKAWVERDAGSGTTSVYNHVEFDGYGEIVSETNAGYAITAGGYTGRFHDSLTGLRYHRKPWTDPHMAWISEDPIGFGGGDVNLYRYVGNGPGNAIDPSGLYDEAPGLGRSLAQGAANVVQGLLETGHEITPYRYLFDVPDVSKGQFMEEPESSHNLSKGLAGFGGGMLAGGTVFAPRV